MARRTKGTHEFPADKFGDAGAVKITDDGESFYVPAVLHGSDGKTAISVTNPLPTANLSIAKSDPSFSGTGNLTKTFTKSMFAFSILNKHTADLTVNIDGSTFTVLAKSPFIEYFEPFTEAAITASGPWEAYGLTYPNLTGVVTPPPPPPDTTVPTVTASVLTGTYTIAKTVTLTANESATIYYTLDGSEPTQSSAVYSSALAINATTTLKYFAKDTAGNTSVVQTQTYTINIDTTAPTVSASPAGGTYGATQNVALTSEAGATIYYTTNGSTPTTGSSVYSAPISISANATLKFIARDAAGNVSSVVTETYTVTIPDTTAPVLTITPAAGTYNATQTVSMSANETATIYYTLDGTEPTESSSVYASSLSFASTTTVKAFARDTAGNSSTVQTMVYTISAAPPADTTAPNPVTGLTAGTPTSNSVPLSWTLSNSGDVASQTVEYSADAGGTWNLASASVNASSNTYNVIGLSPSQAYSFRVSAVDAANNRSTYATATATTAAATSALTDDFNRADSTTSLGTATTGQVWTALVGTWGIIGNQAYCVSATGVNLAVVESGKSDATVQAKFATLTPTNMRLAFRVVDANNTLIVNTDSSGMAYKLFKRVAGTFTALGTSTGVTPTSGDIVKVVLSGSNISVYVNDVQTITATCTDHQTATKHGLANEAQPNARYDNFSVT